LGIIIGIGNGSSIGIMGASAAADAENIFFTADVLM
jgi:hypothetical protein